MSDKVIGLLSAGTHLALSFLLALIATYGSFRIFTLLTRKLDDVEELKRNNIALSILLASTLLASAMILKEVTFPVVSTLQSYLYQGLDWLTAIKLLVAVLGYIVLGLLMAIGSAWTAMNCFMRLTRNLDELGEIRRNNVAVAVTLGAAIVIMGMFLADGIGSVMQALVPFPAVESIEVLGG